jgi:hypothetical protein
MKNFFKWMKQNWAVPLFLVVGVILLIVGSKQGWFDPKIKQFAIDPTNPDNTNDNSTPTISDTKANNLAVAVHDAFVNHYLYWDSDLAVEVMRPISNLKDADLITVGNKYASLYGSKQETWERTLRSILAAEILGAGYLETASAMRDDITNRLSSVGL